MNPRPAAAIALVLLILQSLLPAAPVPDQTASWRIGQPVVSYWAGPGFPGSAPVTDAACKQLAEGGWNLAWARDGELDTLQRSGLRGMLNDPLLVPESLADPVKRAALEALVKRVAKHPALYCYHLTDEPAAGRFDDLAALVKFLRELDPAHLAYINLLPTYASNAQLGTAGDTVTAYREHLRLFSEKVKPALLSYDHYHFSRSGDGGDYFLNLGLIRRHALATGVPFMNIVQASNWVPGEAASPASPRVPDGDELRFLVHTTLAYGGQAISYYVYCWPAHEGGIARPDGSTTPLYTALRSLNREFTAIASELQPLSSLGAWHSGMMPRGTDALPENAVIRPDPALPELPCPAGARVEGLLTGLFGPAGGTPADATHAHVVNLDYRKERRVTLKSAAALEVFDAASATWSPCPGGMLLLPGGGGRLVRRAK
jgi:hypothetical protein